MNELSNNVVGAGEGAENLYYLISTLSIMTTKNLVGQDGGQI